jgi:CRISPR system Cascade subunit CasE
MRSGGWGFAITGNGLGAENLAVVERRTLRFSRHSGPVDDRRRDVVSLTTVTVAGELEVTSAGALRQALAGGLGRAKGYGCGLLTLAPPA